jgi:hypothetical protein
MLEYKFLTTMSDTSTQCPCEKISLNYKYCMIFIPHQSYWLQLETSTLSDNLSELKSALEVLSSMGK